ncbi:MAG: EAL domain-containing protein, partial [Acetobacteraceae bacterium]
SRTKLRSTFTEVKVDRSFVRDLDHDPVQAAMAGAALGIARALGMTACCEGVETAAERDTLLALGCPVAQGYFFSLPLEGEDLIWLMDNHASLPVERQLAHPGERMPHGVG